MRSTFPVFVARAIGVALALVMPAVATAQIEPPDFGPMPFEGPEAARNLFRDVKNGPSVRSGASARLFGWLPEAERAGTVNCLGALPSSWTFAGCGREQFNRTDLAITTTAGADARAEYSTSFGDWGNLFVTDARCAYSGLPMLVPASPLGNACDAGAIARTDFGANRAYARTYTPFDGQVANDDPSVEWKLDARATATSLWTSEFTPTFSGWLTLQFSVERHNPAAVAGDGSADLDIAVFAKPDDLDPLDFAADPQWQFYGSQPLEQQFNSNFWGWRHAFAQSYDDFAVGMTPITAFFEVEAGRTYALASELRLRANGTEVIDFFGTARFDAFEVPTGIDPATAFSFNSAGFTVRNVGATTPTPVPEPATAVLTLGGLAGLVARRCRRARTVSAA